MAEDGGPLAPEMMVVKREYRRVCAWGGGGRAGQARCTRWLSGARAAVRWHALPPAQLPCPAADPPLCPPTPHPRVRSEEELQAQLLDIRSMWEMAAILDFIHLFRPQLRLSRAFTADELERVLVTSSGEDGLLADLHVVRARLCPCCCPAAAAVGGWLGGWQRAGGGGRRLAPPPCMLSASLPTHRTTPHRPPLPALHPPLCLPGPDEGDLPKV